MWLHAVQLAADGSDALLVTVIDTSGTGTFYSAWFHLVSFLFCHGPVLISGSLPWHA